MKRREFIKTSSIVPLGIGLGLGAVSCKQETIAIPVPDSEKIRIGIVGMGDRGSSIIQVLNASPIYKIIACCDILDFRLKEGKEKINGNPLTFKDYREMLKIDELEAIIVSVPLHEHYRIVMDALDADIHIMCEKALAYDIEQSKAIKIKAAKSSKLFQISYQYQLNPTFKAIKNTIQNGYCGKITRIESAWHRNSNWRRAVPFPELERQINWRMYREYSGGLMAELGSHLLNMIDNIVGEHPVKVVGSGGIDYWKDGRETFDNVFAIFDYPNGIKASFSSILANKFQDQHIKFYGDEATIVVNRMKEAYIYPEGDADKVWGENMDGVTGASIKIVHIDKKKQRKITPTEEISDCPFDNNLVAL